MHRILTPFAALAVLGSAVAQHAGQTGRDTGNVETLTSADLNEMEPAEAISLLRGYQYGVTAAGRAGVSDAGTATMAGPGDAPAVGPRNATTIGDVQGSGAPTEGAAGVGGSAAGTPV